MSGKRVLDFVVTLLLRVSDVVDLQNQKQSPGKGDGYGEQEYYCTTNGFHGGNYKSGAAMKLQEFIGLALVLLGAYVAWTLTFGSPLSSGTGSGSGFTAFGGGSMGLGSGAGGSW